MEEVRKNRPEVERKAAGYEKQVKKYLSCAQFKGSEVPFSEWSFMSRAGRRSEETLTRVQRGRDLGSGRAATSFHSTSSVSICHVPGAHARHL